MGGPIDDVARILGIDLEIPNPRFKGVDMPTLVEGLIALVEVVLGALDDGRLTAGEVWKIGVAVVQLVRRARKAIPALTDDRAGL